MWLHLSNFLLVVRLLYRKYVRYLFLFSKTPLGVNLPHDCNFNPETARLRWLISRDVMSYSCFTHDVWLSFRYRWPVSTVVSMHSVLHVAIIPALLCYSYNVPSDNWHNRAIDVMHSTSRAMTVPCPKKHAIDCAVLWHRVAMPLSCSKIYDMKLLYTLYLAVIDFAVQWHDIVVHTIPYDLWL